MITEFIREIELCKHLTSQDKKVILILECNADANGFVKIDENEVLKEVHISAKQLRSSMSWLSKMCYIEVYNHNIIKVFPNLERS